MKWNEKIKVIVLIFESDSKHKIEFCSHEKNIFWKKKVQNVKQYNFAILQEKKIGFRSQNKFSLF